MNTQKSSLKFVAIALFCALSSSAFAQTTWTGNGDATDWSDTGNWSNGLPSSSNAVVFNSSTTITGLFEDYTVSSITFNTGTGEGDEITGVGGAALVVNGAITNNTASLVNFSLTVSTGSSNSTWDGPLKFSNNVNIGTRQITLVDSVQFTGSNLNFDITNTTTYGRFLGSGNASFAGVNINFFGAYTGGVAGDTFDFTTGSFTGATLNFASLPALTSGLSWNTSQFVSQGILSVVNNIPEPSTWAALAGSLGLGLAVYRRRKVA